MAYNPRRLLKNKKIKKSLRRFGLEHKTNKVQLVTRQHWIVWFRNPLKLVMRDHLIVTSSKVLKMNRRLSFWFLKNSDKDIQARADITTVKPHKRRGLVQKIFNVQDITIKLHGDEIFMRDVPAKATDWLTKNLLLNRDRL